MVTKPTNNSPPAAVPSRNALRALRRLAFAGSTVGGFCTVAALTYEAHRRVRIAERIVENKRALQTSAPRYDAKSAAKRLARMMEVAEAGEFMGLDSLREEDRTRREGRTRRAEEPDIPLGDWSSDRQQLQDHRSPAQAEMYANAPSPLSFVDSLRPGPIPQNHVPNAFTPPPTLPRSMDALERSKSLLALKDTSTNNDGLVEAGNTPQEQLSVSERMQQLLDEGKALDAAHLFLESHPATLRGISSDKREVAVKAFYLNCKQGNVMAAKNVFERLEEVDKISHGMWKVLLFALAKKGCIENVGTIFTRYMHQFKIPAEILDIVLRCLLESHRLTTAKWVLLRNLDVDRGCGLCGVYLTGLWKKTRSIELMNGQFKKLLTILPRLGKQVTDKLFNPVIKAYVDFGRLADAEALALEMTTTYGIPLRCRTKGLLVFGKALACDWEGVRAGLQEMHELKLTKRVRDFTPVFDRIFLQYWVSHSAADISDFIHRYIEQFEIVPDKVLYKHILEALVEKGDNAMVDDFLRLARERGWPKFINEEEFLETLRARRHALEDSPVGFWQMLQAARLQHGQVASSQHILGFDQQSFPSPQVNLMPYTQSPLAWYERTMQPMTPSKPVDQYQKLHKQMSHYMHVGKLVEALKCYQNAKNAKFHVKQLHVELAVICTLLEHGLDAARALIDADWRHIRDFIRFFPQFFRQIMEVDSASEGELIKLAVLRFYELCWSNKKMTVKHHITVATSRRLIVVQKPELAIDLLTAVYMSRYQRSLSFDGVCMKMFLRAFSATDNLPGIRWCILTGLARGSAINSEFVNEARRVVGALERQPTPESTKPKDAARQAKKVAYLTHVTDLLARKCAGDTEMWQLKADSKIKRDGRRLLKRPLDERHLYNTAQVPQTIARWDEEYELETVLGRIDIDPKSIVIRWSEKHCLGQVPYIDDLV
ncbi:hypothetical protein BO70DRAFT_364698 [Aspergillus heteromorphus CBS 117.55]|uniref:Pentatricopeptide repeat protein n=1 Tax=Aspergillus heteromorphus CBS 117.55 TaxID=1448321 RepID=A0A317VIA7_9EURO|nr:uncharacterized protein BO70DRAFT_364698 [Aspergillus heteromorphus CBS 117.55]PWY72917.1 hypothetical protein BO70DRAFT_364698 [Aspergillus heteromorphus CBS 117.55]